MWQDLEINGINFFMAFSGHIKILPITLPEKSPPSYFGIDLHAPSKAALALLSSMSPVGLEDYRESLILLLFSARELAACSIQISI